MTLKPESSGVSSPDYNDRQSISNPHYVKRPNVVAYAGTLATTVGGAYGMYKFGPVTHQTPEGNQKLDAANIFLGALTGFAIGTAIQYAAGKNKRVPLDNAQNWIKKADDGLTVYNYQNERLVAIPKANTNNYVVKELNDLKGYYRVFPQGGLKSDLYLKSLDIVKREELPEVVVLESNQALIDKAKYTYFDRSSSVDQLSEANQRYASFKYPLETKGIQLTKSYDDAKKMFTLVPSLKNKKGLYINSLLTPYTPSEAKEMLQKIGKDNFLLEEADVKNANSTQHRHTLENIFYAVQPKDMEYGFKILSKYNFLKFNTKKEFAMSYFWDKIYDKYSMGSKIINEFSNLGEKFEINKLGLSKNDLNSHVIYEMENEARENIMIVENNYLSTKSDYIDSWKKSAYWDAIFISSTGELKFLEYGVIKNNSKFDLPVKVSAYGELGSVTSYDFLNLIQGQERATFQGSSSNEFVIPLLKSGEKQVYSILLDYGFKQQATGINILGFQTLNELKLFNRKVNLSYLPFFYTAEQIQQQNLWLDMLKSGMTKTKVIDPTNWSGSFEYLPQNYDMTWEKFINQWKKNLAESWSNQSYSSASSSKQVDEKTQKLAKKIEDCINEKDQELVAVGTSESLLIGKCNPCTVFKVPAKWVLGSASSYYLLLNEQQKWYYGHDSDMFDNGPYKTKREAILKNFCNNIQP